MKKEKKLKVYNEDGDANHYNSNRINEINKMEQIWGTQGVMIFCEINAFKYKSRIGKKPGQSLEQEITKIEWYEKAAAYYFEKMSDPNRCISGISYFKKIDLPWK